MSTSPNGRRRAPLTAEREHDAEPQPADPTLVEPAVDPTAVDELATRMIADPDDVAVETRGLAGHSALPLAVLFGLQAVDELDRTAFGVLSPEIRDDFDLSLGAIQAIASLVGSLALVAALLVGYLGDRHPRVRIALLGASLWGVFSLGTGVAPTVAFLVVARIGAGIGRAVNDPTHRSLLADYYPPEARGWAYYVHTGANSLGIALAPFLAGAVFTAFDSWRAAFIVFAGPTLALVVVGFAQLREPVRGFFERQLAGGDVGTLELEEEPPSFGEAWRAIHAVASLKRTLLSLPFLGTAFFGLGTLVNNFYDDEYGLSPFERGAWGSLSAIGAIAGFVVFAKQSTRFITTDPQQIYKAVAVATIPVSVGFIGIAAAPSFPLSIASWVLLSFAAAPLTAGPAVVMSLVIPPRIRTLGYAAGALYLLPAAFILVPIAGLAESRSYTYAFTLLAPILLLGSWIIVTSGRMVNADIARVRDSALAQAESAVARAKGEAKLLIAKGVDVKYGSTQVLFGVDIEIDDGEIVALLGTNGAGKSTFLNAVTGLVDPSAGAIVFDGRDITNLPAEEAVAMGIVMVPGGKGVFPTLTVRENMELAGWLFDQEAERIAAATEEVLEYFPILRERWDEKAGNMSGGEQQMLTLGQAFIARPRLLLIDELSLGLAPVIVEQLLDIVRAIHAQGTTVVIVEQSVNVACTLAERAVFMEKGEVRFDGPTADLLDRPDVLRAVFLQGAAAADGADDERDDAVALVDREIRTRQLEVAKVALETRGLSIAFGGIRAVNGVDLSIRQGEILGLIGPNGAGKTTIMDLVSGFLEPTEGRVFLHGSDVTDLGPDARADLGLGRSFQDARLFPSLTVRETVAIAHERHIRTKDPLAAALGSPATRASEREVTERVEELLELMNLQAFADKFIGELSTGSRRVVDLACSVAHQPSVLLLDEPSSGIAQRETEALGPVLLDIRDRTGAALLVIEHDMPLIQGISDRLLALELGTVVTEGPPAEVIEHPQVVESYLGGSDVVINRSGSGSDVRRGEDRDA